MNENDTISRQLAIDAVIKRDANCGIDSAEVLRSLPSAQPERDIPKKPIATTDTAWGIPAKQAVCPNCDCYLGQVYFICEGDYSGKRITYCETCGQAIDWSDWRYEDE